jgi:hypothetical protein
MSGPTDSGKFTVVFCSTSVLCTVISSVYKGPISSLTVSHEKCKFRNLTESGKKSVDICRTPDACCTYYV